MTHKLVDEDMYQLAKLITHMEGMPWTDPRTRKVYPPPMPRKQQRLMVGLFAAAVVAALVTMWWFAKDKNADDDMRPEYDLKRRLKRRQDLEAQWHARRTHE